MMKYKPTILASVFMIFLAGCDTQLDPTKKDGSGTLRNELFKQCLEIAKEFDNRLEQLSLDESSYGVAEIIEQCDNTSYYQSNHISNEG